MANLFKKIKLYWDQHRDNPEYYDFIMSNEEKALFKNVISDASYYLEFGSGGSTIFALENSAAKIISVESNSSWLDQMKKYKIIRKNLGYRLNFKIVDIGATKNWGYPADNSRRENFPNFSAEVFKEFPLDFDTVLVDGRFRVACTLQTILYLREQKNLKILFHDYSLREAYHVIEEFLDVRESAASLFLFSLKENIDQTRLLQLYEKYKYNPE